MPKTLTPLEKRLAGYAAAAGLVLAAAPDADAQVVYVDLDPDVCAAFGSNPAIDFDGDATSDVTVIHNTFGAYGLYGDLNFAAGEFVAVSATGYYARAMSSGDPVSSGQTFGSGLFSALFGTGYGLGEWLGGRTAFVGFQFLAGGATNHFGWMRVTVPSDHLEVCVEDYAFDATPDTPINAATVPVELVSFDARVNGGDVILNWETASETNNAGFEVQLQNGEDWTVLGFVEGNGTTTEAQSYSFAATDLGVGTHTFRLKQIDFDGAFEYFGNVEASIEVVGTHQLSNAYPNPFNPSSQFTLAVAREQRVTAELYNVLGQRVATLFDGSVEANSSRTIQIDGAGLASGAYVIRVSGETFADALRVTLTK